MAGNERREPAQVDRDRKRIAELYLKRWLQVDIAEELKIDQSTVSRDLAAIREQWRKSTLIDFNEAKARELARIDNLEMTYFEAWDRSLDPFKSKVIKAKGNPKTEEELKANAEQTLKTEDRNGDPRFLQGVQWCIEQRCQILGIYAAVKQEITGADNGPVILKVVYGNKGTDGTSEETTPQAG